MSLFLVLLTFVVLIILDLVKSARKQAVQGAARSKGASQSRAVAERYFHPGHSWVLVNSPREVTVGVDDFAQKVIGRLSSIILPSQGTRVQQGQSFVTLQRGRRALTQVAPVSGIITDVNASVLNDPSVVNASPLHHGWIAKIAPSNLEVERRNLLKGISASHWEEAIRNQLVQRIFSSVQPVLQDGGKIVDNVSDLITDEEWQGFVDEFFPAAVNRNEDKQI